MKTVRLKADREKIDTEIDLREGEFVSIMATGKVRRGAGAEQEPKSWGLLAMWINSSKSTLFWNISGKTFQSVLTGRLYLGFKSFLDLRNAWPAPARLSSGHFDFLVVVWKTDDFGKIAGFLEELHRKAPDHPGIADALASAKEVQATELAKAETTEEIAATQKKMDDLQASKTIVAGASAAEDDPQVRALQSRLVELTAKLERLDEVSRELKQEREKAAQLSQELQEGQRREKALLTKIGEGAKVPPLVVITSPEDGFKTEAAKVRLTGAVEDEHGLLRLEVLVNGRPVPTDDSRGIHQVEGESPRRLTFECWVPLAKGENRLRVKATDTDALVTDKTLIVHYTPVRRNVWAVIVGINDYPNLPKLKYAVNDAREFQRFLVDRNGVPVENITMLLNEQATLRNFRSSLGTQLKADAAADDMAIIFFAGHGATERDPESPDGDGLEKYLLAWESEPGDLYSTAMPMREIAYIFRRIRSQRLVFIADSCYSGGSGGRTIGTTGMRANLSDTFMDRIASGIGKVIITASAANEVSVEKDELQHGVFTYYLLEGLKGPADTDQDGMVTVDEAYLYVSEKVSRETGQEQHPMKKGSVQGKLVLSISQ
jgi:Caspase domain